MPRRCSNGAQRRGDADLVVFPELQLIGYPPEDLVLKPALAERSEAALAKLAEATADGGPAMLVGAVIRREGLLYNAVALLDGGKVAAIRCKHELPNYGTFDEKRVFAAGPLPEPIAFRGVRLGVPICEDIWFPLVAAHLKKQGAELLIVPNGSPYEIDKDDVRSTRVAKARVAETGCLWFISTASGDRTSWYSTARRSCWRGTGLWSTSCPIGRKRW